MQQPSLWLWWENNLGFIQPSLLLCRDNLSSGQREPQLIKEKTLGTSTLRHLDYNIWGLSFHTHKYCKNVTPFSAKTAFCFPWIQEKECLTGSNVSSRITMRKYCSPIHDNNYLLLKWKLLQFSLINVEYSCIHFV
jgi:hypothetical protein